ncbi:MAG: hypothetical protein HUU46_08260 [Candidatus Hydrogenedentes bacterium]|nr:hypothetical protein [Candidatus Hydrogenedentota bacterium]
MSEAVDSNEFYSPTFGFKVTKPGQWRFICADEYMRHVQTVTSNDEMFLRYANVPLMSAAKYEEPHPDLNPSIKVQVKPNRSGPINAKEMAGILLDLMRRFADDFAAEGPDDCTVGGAAAVRTVATYTMGTVDGQSFPVYSELWVVPRASQYFLIAVSRRQDAPQSDVEDLRHLVESICFE